jgi:hypothetical protein
VDVARKAEMSHDDGKAVDLLAFVVRTTARLEAVRQRTWKDHRQATAVSVYVDRFDREGDAEVASSSGGSTRLSICLAPRGGSAEACISIEWTGRGWITTANLSRESSAGTAASVWTNSSAAEDSLGEAIEFADKNVDELVAELGGGRAF